MSGQIVYRGRLKPAVEHAVGTFGIAPQAVVFPIGLIYERLETRGVALVQQKVTGPLPAEDVAGRVAPGSALIGPISG